MRFLFVSPEVCPWVSISPTSGFLRIPPRDGHPCLRLHPSRYRADSGLSPVRTCARRAHYIKRACAVAFKPQQRKLFTSQLGIFLNTCAIPFSQCLYTEYTERQMPFCYPQRHFTRFRVLSLKSDLNRNRLCHSCYSPLL